MSTILHIPLDRPNTRITAARKRNPVLWVGHVGQTVCLNAVCSIDGSEAAVELTLEQAEQLVLQLRAEVFAANGRKI